MNDIKKIVDMYVKENKSTYEIAECMNTYPNKIRRLLIKNGVELKDKSEAQKNAIKLGKAQHPTKGRNRSKEEKLKISSGIKNYWENMDDKTYEDKVKKSKERWEKMGEKERTLMMEAAIKAIQIAGKEGSKLEKFIYNEICGMGFKVDFHKKYLIQNENLEIDMYIPEIKTIIEVDGPSHFLPIWGDEKLQKQIKADYNKTGLILSKGMVIIRIKNLSDSVCLSDREKLKNNLSILLNKIKLDFPKKSERYIELEV